MLCIADHRLDRTTLINEPIPTTSQHLAIDVAHHHTALRADTSCKCEGQVARAAGDIEHVLASPDIGLRDCRRLPGPMQAQRHQVIHQVIADRDRIKYPGYPLGFFSGRDLFKAEVGGVLIHRPILVAATAPGSASWLSAAAPGVRGEGSKIRLSRGARDI